MELRLIINMSHSNAIYSGEIEIYLLYFSASASSQTPSAAVLPTQKDHTVWHRKNSDWLVVHVAVKEADISYRNRARAKGGRDHLRLKRSHPHII